MSDLIELAKDNLLAQSDVTEQALSGLLGNLLGHTIDNADIYLQHIAQESWTLEDSIVKEGDFTVSRGAGVRANAGEQTGFAYSDEIMLPSLTLAAKAANSIAKKGFTGRQVVPSHVRLNQPLYQPINPISALCREKKIQLLHDIDKLARQNPKITQVIVSLSGVYESVLILTSSGRLAADIRPLVRLDVQVIAEDKNKKESGYAGGGGRFDYDYFFKEDMGLSYAREAVRLALLNLTADKSPAGCMEVVLGAGWPGILLHEAVGHGLEGDFNRKGTSVFSGRVGERVASPLCTVVDDGTLTNRRGSLNIDDEGHPTQCNVLIENGILKGYLQDSLNARLMNVAPTGNGRRESYSHLPMPRMTNTYMHAGKHDPQEIIASVKKGLYAANFGGGQVDITSGKFVFSTSNAYLIENGQLTRPVKGATLIGNGPEVLKKVSMVGNDLALDNGVGTCGKDGQSVPVGVGMPTIKVDELTVGGTA